MSTRMVVVAMLIVIAVLAVMTFPKLPLYVLAYAAVTFGGRI